MHRWSKALVAICLLGTIFRAPAALASPADLRAEIERFQRSERAAGLAFTAVFSPVTADPGPAEGTPAAAPTQGGAAESTVPATPATDAATDTAKGTAVGRTAGSSSGNSAACPGCVSFHPDRPLIPASVTKLVTTSAALEAWGPRHLFHTQVWSDGRIRRGVLDGNLIVRGGGDPFLVTERLWLLAHELQLKGVTEVTGRLVIDLGAFVPEAADTARLQREDSDRPYAAGLSPLTVNFNAITVRVEPGAGPGEAAFVGFDPFPCAYLRLVNRVRTGAPGGKTAWSVRLAQLDGSWAASSTPAEITARGGAEIRSSGAGVGAERSSDPAHPTDPADTLTSGHDGAPTLSASPMGGDAPSIGSGPPRGAAATPEYADSLAHGEVVIVEGVIAADAEPQFEYRSVEHPDAFSAALIRTFLAEAGITVRGATVFGSIPRKASLLLDFPSLPLADLVGSTNRHSNNLMADLLAMSLSTTSPVAKGWETTTAADAVQVPASLSHGARVLTRWLRDAEGLAPRSAQEIVLHDGSGLSPRNRLTGAALVHLLQRDWNDFRIQPALLASLPGPGEEGTLRRRWKEVDPRPPVRAKTGTLGDHPTSALAGYLVDRRHGVVAFALIMNGRSGWSVAEMQALQDAWILKYLQ
ncbi:MAG: D-alanyl-D-alanine carboxypeptidase [Candidatus Eisenbacteria bacterium]|nr:D-alanyl-D-alanine carboxypeptidase [Candidatus Eisenbacteria bacterium]